ncbi:MAG: hypothetical protein ACTS3R_07750 [Inquilinaceae bacterium]
MTPYRHPPGAAAPEPMGPEEDAFGVVLYEDSSADEVDAQIAQLCVHPAYRMAAADALHPQHEVAVRSMYALNQARAEALEAMAPTAPPPPAGLTPDRARNRIDAARDDAGFMEAYMDRDHDRHLEAVELMRLLHLWGFGPDPAGARGGR